VIDSTGSGVNAWKTGDRVGVGWHGGRCFVCEYCRQGDFVNCVERKIVGLSYDGGYAEYMVAPQDALARIPDALSFEEAGPMVCAGMTTFNSLRHSGARPGDTVAVHGIGGLGHLALQFADKMGFRTIAINRGRPKEALARKLGVNEYIDSNESSVGEALTCLGGRHRGNLHGRLQSRASRFDPGLEPQWAFRSDRQRSPADSVFDGPAGVQPACGRRVVQRSCERQRRNLWLSPRSKAYVR